MKKIVTIMILLSFSQVFSQINSLLYDEGVGKYRYIEKDATTYVHYRTNYGTWTSADVWVFVDGDGSGTGYNYPANWVHNGTNYGGAGDDQNHLSTGNLSSSNHNNDWVTGALIDMYYNINGVSNGAQNLDYWRIIDITTNSSNLSTGLVDNPTGTQNLVLDFIISAGAIETLQRTWFRINSGTAVEGTDIPNAGLKLYYENAPGDGYSGSESSAQLYGDYNGNSTSNQEWGHDALGISVPSGGLRCYLVVNDLAATVNTAHTAVFSIMTDGISLSNGMVRIDETVSGGGEIPLPVELTSFTALIKNKSVNLVWHTATEVNNYGFEIEKRQSSVLNSQWSKVGFVNGNGNSNSANDYSYTDKTVTSGKYTYRLKQIDNDGQFEYSKEVEVDLGKPTTFALNQNYPNPFNPSTSIQYSVVGSQYVSLKVFNVLGKEVAVLVNEKQEPGTYTVDFTSANLSGGAYFYRLQAGDFVQTKKMILLK